MFPVVFANAPLFWYVVLAATHGDSLHVYVDNIMRESDYVGNTVGVSDYVGNIMGESDYVGSTVGVSDYVGNIMGEWISLVSLWECWITLATLWVSRITLWECWITLAILWKSRITLTIFLESRITLATLWESGLL